MSRHFSQGLRREHPIHQRTLLSAWFRADQWVALCHQYWAVFFRICRFVLVKEKQKRCSLLFWFTCYIITYWMGLFSITSRKWQFCNLNSITTVSANFRDFSYFYNDCKCQFSFLNSLLVYYIFLVKLFWFRPRFLYVECVCVCLGSNFLFRKDLMLKFSGYDPHTHWEFFGDFFFFFFTWSSFFMTTR